MSSLLPPARLLRPEVTGFGFFLCVSKERRPARAGDFLRLMLQDRTGQFAARIFDNVESLAQEFEAGEFVRVAGHTELHHGQVQLVIERIRRVIDQDRREGFDEAACLECAPRPAGEMWAELCALAADVRDPFIRRLLTTLLEEHASRLRIWPAAVSVHHAYRGGLLEHVLQVARTSRALAEAYGADVDVALAGAILHDLGKLRELEYETATAYTRDGNLLGHLAIGAAMLDAACATIDGFPDALRAHLQHIVLAHHGARDRGSPVVPMTVEAFIVAAADDLDAKLFQVRRAMGADTGDAEFTAYDVRLERRFWKGPQTPRSGGAAS